MAREDAVKRCYTTPNDSKRQRTAPLTGSCAAAAAHGRANTVFAGCVVLSWPRPRVSEILVNQRLLAAAAAAAAARLPRPFVGAATGAIFFNLPVAKSVIFVMPFNMRSTARVSRSYTSTTADISDNVRDNSNNGSRRVGRTSSSGSRGVPAAAAAAAFFCAASLKK